MDREKLKSNIILITGAPRSDDLKWEEEGLLESFTPVYQRILDSSLGGRVGGADCSTSQPRWRLLRLDDESLESSDDVSRGAQSKATTAGDVKFFDSQCSTTSSMNVPFGTEIDLSNTEWQGEDQSLFLEHSFAVYTQTPSHEVEDTTVPDTTTMTTTSIQTDCSEDVTEDPSIDPSGSTSKIAITLSNYQPVSLNRLPSVTYLSRIAPQTMTIDLVVGIVSIAPVRTVELRRGRRHMEIVEMLVGDDTKTGFGISFWLPPVESQMHEPLREALRGVRRQDVVLVRHVALSFWKGLVYGQSLNRKTAKNATEVILLVRRNVLDENDDRGLLCERELRRPKGAQMTTVRRVSDWVSRFVGPTAGRDGGRLGPKTSRKRKLETDDSLPPDTQ